MTLRTTFTALALVSLLSACGGGGGGDVADPQPLNPTIGGSDLATIQDQLGITADTNETMRAATINGGVLGNGQIYVDSALSSIRTSMDTASATLVTVPGAAQNVMNGAVARTRDGATVYYLPRPGSNMQVGMVHHNVVGDDAMAGVFGSETGANGMANRIVAGGTATYSGQVEYSRDVSNQVVSYNGQIGATVDFDNGSLTTSSGTLSKNTNTGGAATMALSGNGTFNGNGTITGSFATTSTDGNQTGTLNGSFYGDNGQNIGFILLAPNAVGGAILNENP